MACCAVLEAPSAALAAGVEIEFDFSGSTLSWTGIPVPPNGSITTGPVKIRIPGAGSMTASSGTASLTGLDLYASLDFPYNPGVLEFTGHHKLRLLAPPPALFSLTTNLSLLTPVGPATFANEGFWDCSGTMCGSYYPGMPYSYMQTVAASPPPFVLQSVNVPGAASVMGTLMVTQGLFRLNYNLVGTEVSRSNLPEPGKTTQLASAILALGALHWLRRRRSLCI